MTRHLPSRTLSRRDLSARGSSGRLRGRGLVARTAPFAVLIATALTLLAGGARAADPYWVFFRDRGPLRLDAAAMARVAEEVPPAAWAVRASSPAAALPDERDLPLWEPYVQEVALHGAIRHRTRWLNGVSASLDPDGLVAVRSLPFVRELRPVARAERQSLGPEMAPDGTPLGATLPNKAAARGPEPYGPAYGQLTEIQVPAVHALGYTGNRVRMMMLDTGFRKSHHAFQLARILHEWDFVFGDGDVENEPEDDPNQHNHGTGCWAVAGGYDSGYIVGPAFGADFILCKTEDVRSETQAEEDNYVAALEWADQLGVRVTSASLGYVCFDDGFCYDYPLKDGDTPVISRAVDIAAARGILCVNSAGNYGWNGPMSLGTPADADTMLAVGAVDSLNQISGFSSRGPSDDGRTKPEVVARGHYTWWADASAPYAYGFASGTSLAAPLVGGAAALLAEAHPEWNNLQIRSALMMTADRHVAPDNDYGWGRIDVLAALQTSPVIFPVPFDLVSPADHALLANLQPLFVWRASEDPDEAASPAYTVRIWDPAPGGASWSVAAGTDTSRALSFPLAPGTEYRWEVWAEDASGHRRVSRETRNFFTPGGAGIDGDDPPVTDGMRLRVGPNPSSGAVRIEASGLSAGAEEGGAAPPEWRLFDPLGRRVASGRMAPTHGSAEVLQGHWDGELEDGRPAAAGVYYLEVRAGARYARQPLVRLPAR